MKWPWSWPPSMEKYKRPSTYLTPEILLPTIALTSTTLVLIHVYKSYLRRIPDTSAILPEFFRRRSIFGKVTSVGDGDNFRIYHTPGGKLMGWGWLRKIPETRLELREKTVHVRLAGIDAPEGAHFGNPSQPYSAEALAWLKKYVLGRNVRAYIYRRDQYERVVGSVKVWKLWWRKDVGLEMLRAGMATVYEAKFGAEYGTLEAKYRQAEIEAKQGKLGIWSLRKRVYVSPAAYKKALKDKALKEKEKEIRGKLLGGKS